MFGTFPLYEACVKKSALKGRSWQLCFFPFKNRNISWYIKYIYTSTKRIRENFEGFSALPREIVPKRFFKFRRDKK